MTLPGSAAAWCGSDQLGEKEDNLAEDCEEFVGELVVVDEDTFAALSWWCWCQPRSGRPGWSGAETREVSRKEARGRFVEPGAGSETSVPPGAWPGWTGPS